MRPPRPFGERIERVAETGSTMDDARALAEEGASEGTVVVADAQTGGRGRAGRSWASPRGGVYLTVVLRPAMPPARWGLVPIAAGIAVHEAIRPQAPKARLKWPNDVVLPHGDRWLKVAGVLVETKPPAYALVGVGLNAATAPSSLPEGATSLAALGHVPDRRVLERRILTQLEGRYADLEAGRPESVRTEWTRRQMTLGREVRVGDVRGTASRLGEHGTLVVRAPDGSEVDVLAGDVADAT